MRQTLSLFLMTLLAAAPAVAFQTPQATAPTTPLRIGGQTKAPERIHYVAPAYPEAAMAARVSGIVIVEATISKEGNVTDARVLRSIAGLDQAALTAVKQWKYLPTTVDGKPVPVVMTVSVNFTPPGAEAPTPAPMPPPAPPSVRTPQAPTPPPAPDAPKPPAVDPRFDTSDVNLKLTIKVTDKSSGGEQIKTVSLIAANRNSGRVRSNGTTRLSNGNTRDSTLNVDARMTLYKSGAIFADLTLTYTPEFDAETTVFSGMNETIGVFLKDGVPTIVTQSADPTKGSRSVTVEVTAQVMR